MGRSADIFRGKQGLHRSSCFFVVLILLAGLLPGSVTAVSAAPRADAPAPASAVRPADFGQDATKSADLVLDGRGDAQGYHVAVGRESGGFAWQEIALIRPAGMDDSSWVGYQCLSGDGKYVAVAVLPASAVNQQAARDHGALAYSVEVASGAVRPVAAGVGLKYFSPGCGTGDEAVFTVDVGPGDTSTRLLSANLATGKIDSAITTPGQVTSAVPTSTGIVGAAGSRLVAVPADGKARTLATSGDISKRPANSSGS